jgi:hypothetical protein
MAKAVLFLFFGVWSIFENAQQKIVPTWKAGHAWINKALSSSPSDSKKMDEISLETVKPNLCFGQL